MVYHIYETIEYFHQEEECNGFSRVRAIHNVANGPKVNVDIDGNAVLTNVCYKDISDYLIIPAGDHCVGIATDKECKQFIANKTFNFVAGSDYTLVVHGLATEPASIDILALEDNNNVPAYVRFIHASAGSPAVDIYEATDVDNPKELFNNISYGNFGNYRSVEAGKANIAVTAHGSEDVVLGPIPVTFCPGNVYTIIASGIIGDCNCPLNALVTCDTKQGEKHNFKFLKGKGEIHGHKEIASVSHSTGSGSVSDGKYLGAGVVKGSETAVVGTAKVAGNAVKDTTITVGNVVRGSVETVGDSIRALGTNFSGIGSGIF